MKKTPPPAQTCPVHGTVLVFREDARLHARWLACPWPGCAERQEIAVDVILRRLGMKELL